MITRVVNFSEAKLCRSSSAHVFIFTDSGELLFGMCHIIAQLTQSNILKCAKYSSFLIGSEGIKNC